MINTQIYPQSMLSILLLQAEKDGPEQFSISYLFQETCRKLSLINESKEHKFHTI